MRIALIVGSAFCLAVISPLGAASACELDGLPGAHRFMPFHPVVSTSPAPPVVTPRASRERPSRQARTEDRRRSSGSRRSDDGQGYPSHATRPDSADGLGAPGDADWIHSARDR